MDVSILVACACVYLALLTLKATGVLWCIRSRRAVARESASPPPDWMQSVTVLQPILSGDDALYTVLNDTVSALPGAAFCWLVDRDDPVALDSVAAIQRAHPAVAIEVRRFGPAPAGVNPKMFKLAAALPSVGTPIAVVLDDDARLSVASLQQMVTELAHADLVTALPFYRDTTASLGSQLLAQFVNNNSALTYLATAPVMAPVSINGMCYALWSNRVSAADALSPIVTCLADDLALAGLFQHRGLRLRQSTSVVEMETTTPTLVRYRQQMHRWFLFATLLVAEQPTDRKALIVTLYVLPPLVLAPLVAAALFSRDAWAWCLVLGVLLLRAATLVGVQRMVTSLSHHRPLISVVSELLQPLHLLHACVDRTIIWRTRRYRVRSNHDFIPV